MTITSYSPLMLPSQRQVTCQALSPSGGLRHLIMPLLGNCGFAGSFQQKQMEVRDQRLGIEQPHHQGG
jgi:hypothetical protein